MALPALVGTYDNYIWILYQDKKAWIIDPGESKQVIQFLTDHQLEPQAILITHFHFDHVDGIPDLVLTYPNLTIYGPEKTENPYIKIRLKEGSTVRLTDDFELKVLDTPGHTTDHISFYNEQVLFCADTLFTAGCGRILGGTVAQFSDSILKLRALPDSLDFYCAHEYTEDNLAFAKLVEPDNQRLIARIEQTVIDYPSNHLGAFSTLAEEKATNPFLRFDTPAIKQQLIARGAEDTAESLFETLRLWKDQIDQAD